MCRYLMCIILLRLSVEVFGQSASSDCINSFNICNWSEFYFGDIPSEGLEQEYIKEVGGIQKSGTSSYEAETNALWVKWQIELGGDLVFDITPLDKDDDIDFVIYQASEGCNGMRPVRSMLSGPNVPSLKRSSGCMGSTGLSRDSEDVKEVAGCEKGDDNYLKALQANAGDTYYLQINNYESSKGLIISFEGTAKALCSSQTNNIEIIPNPASSFLRINHSHAEQLIFYIIDSAGKLVMKGELEDTDKVDIAHLPSGTYRFLTQTDDEIQSHTWVKM